MTMTNETEARRQEIGADLPVQGENVRTNETTRLVQGDGGGDTYLTYLSRSRWGVALLVWKEQPRELAGGQVTGGGRSRRRGAEKNAAASFDNHDGAETLVHFRKLA